jgi:hypothetical protein
MRQLTANHDWEPREVDGVMLQNIAAGAWLAFLIGFGCIVLDAYAESARRQECVMRGAAVCSGIPSMAGPAREEPGAHTRTGLAEHLKYSRRW